MNKLFYTLLFYAIILMSGCELYDDVSLSVKRKAVVHLVYHYDNGVHETLDGIESIRLFIYDHQGKLYRDTSFTSDEFIQDTGAMQTYISNGNYSFISWANICDRTVVTPSRIEDTSLAIADRGADCLMFGRCDAPIAKGDSLQFHIHLFKSVFKINVQVIGLSTAPNPEDHYFGIINRSALTIDNRPTGYLKKYRPDLVFQDGVLFGSFYTPYFCPGEDFTIGIYCDNPASQYSTLCETTIRQFANFTEDAIGKDIEINVNININDAGIEIVVSDWNGRVIQEEHLGV